MKTKPETTKPKPRHFFFAYSADNNYQIARGNITVTNSIGEMPSNKWVKERAVLMNSEKGFAFKATDVVITNIFEFKNEQDFKNFTDEN